MNVNKEEELAENITEKILIITSSHIIVEKHAGVDCQLS